MGSLHYVDLLSRSRMLPAQYEVVYKNKKHLVCVVAT